METYIHKGCVIKIAHDEDPGDPRVERDNQFTMVCAPGGYKLGDKDGISQAQDDVRSSPKYRPCWEDYDNPVRLDLDDPGDLHTALERCGMIMLPLYVYEHGGITMSTTGFSCPWDSGQVGFIYAHPVSVRKEHNWKRITAKRREQVLKWMKGEVKEYDQYLPGDVWGYVVEKPWNCEDRADKKDKKDKTDEDKKCDRQCEASRRHLRAVLLLV